MGGTILPLGAAFRGSQSSAGQRTRSGASPGRQTRLVGEVNGSGRFLQVRAVCAAPDRTRRKPKCEGRKHDGGQVFHEWFLLKPAPRPGAPMGTKVPHGAAKAREGDSRQGRGD